MKKGARSDVFTATNSLKVLSYLAGNPGREFLSSEVQRATSISRAGVYIALNDLLKQKLISKNKKGRFLFYSIIYNDSAIKQFKVLKNILLLRSLVSKIKAISKKIVLYGSTSRGEDDPESDIDLFVLSNDPKAIREKLLSIKMKRKIQAVIKSPSELANLKENDKVFYNEIDRGVTLWENKI